MGEKRHYSTCSQEVSFVNKIDADASCEFLEKLGCLHHHQALIKDRCALRTANRFVNIFTLERITGFSLYSWVSFANPQDN